MSLIAVLVGAGFSATALAEDASSMALVLGKAGASYPDRIAAVKSLSRSLSTNDIAALYGFLACTADQDNSLPGELNALKNDVVNALKMQQAIPAGLSGHLMAMYGDPAQNTVWRDYCIQHLGDLYPEIKEKDIRTRALALLWNAADEKQGSIPGTALIALYSHAGTEGFEKDKIAAKAVEMVKLAAYGEPAKITALQIAASLGEKRVLADARKMAVDAPAPLRVSAIACLGIMGDESDLPLLEASQASTDIRLRTAAREAVRKLTAKSGSKMK